MKLSEQELIKIVEQASTLEERISGDYNIINTEENSKLRSMRKDEWIKKVYKDRADLFEERIKRYDAKKEIINYLGEVELKDKTNLPAWSKELNDIINFVSEFDYDSIKEINSSKIPFIHFFEPFLEYGKIKILNSIPSHSEYINNFSVNTLKQSIINKLFPFYSKVLLLEFNIYKLRNRGNFGRILEAAENYNSAELYKEFAEYILKEKLVQIYLEYSYLARLTAVILTNEINNLKISLERFITDKDEIEESLFNGESLGKITKAESGLSDSHSNGKTVIKFLFENGETLLYKPKVTKIDSAFNNLLDSLAKNGLGFDFKNINVIEKDDYCWVEFIKAAPCNSKEEVQKYYTRIGAYLALVYILNGNDYHAENIVASGEYPVLVDLETIMHPVDIKETTFNENNPEQLANKNLFNSVLRVGLLPNWGVTMGDVQFDISGLGGFGEQNTHLKYFAWENINSDKMQVIKKEVTFAEKQNMPYLEGKVQTAYDYLDKIVAGFTKLYKLIQNNPSIITDEFLNGKKLRYVYRATHKYSTIIQFLENPNMLRNGIQRGFYYDFLAIELLEDKTRTEKHWQIYNSEVEQFKQNDVPIFYMKSDTSDFILHDGLIETIIPNTTSEKIKSRVLNLNEKDFTEQLRFIKGSILFRDIDSLPTEKELLEEHHAEIINEVFDKSKFINAAEDIFNLLNEYKIESKNSVSWMGIGFHNHTKNPYFKPMPIILYEGITGVGIFLAAYYKLTQNENGLELLNKIISGLENIYSDKDYINSMFRYQPIGIAGGVSSIFYSLLLISEFTGNTSLLKLAQGFADKLTYEIIDNDDKFDIIAGSAGAILAFLKLYKATGNKENLNKAIYCGEHLLKNRKTINEKYNVITTFKDLPLTGFSHGAAGIAHSLLKLYEVTNDDKFYSAAEEHINYENSLFNKLQGNWPDLREDQTNNFVSMTSWCHGAPGIGLARLGNLNVMNNEMVVHDINAAIKRSGFVEHGLKIDHCCCGKSGLDELMFEAGRRLNRPELTRNALINYSNIINKYEKQKSFRLFNNRNVEIYNFGFFQGLSGIGYQLLRCVDSDSLPSVLLFE